MNQENVKRIMNGEKTTLPSLRNIEWRTLKINQVLPYISTNNITELNKLIYAGAKLVLEKIGIIIIIIPSKRTRRTRRRPESGKYTLIYSKRQ